MDKPDFFAESVSSETRDHLAERMWHDGYEAGRESMRAEDAGIDYVRDGLRAVTEQRNLLIKSESNLRAERDKAVALLRRFSQSLMMSDDSTFRCDEEVRAFLARMEKP